jgi:hypothetical protein
MGGGDNHQLQQQASSMNAAFRCTASAWPAAGGATTWPAVTRSSGQQPAAWGLVASTLPSGSSRGMQEGKTERSGGRTEELAVGQQLPLLGTPASNHVDCNIQAFSTSRKTYGTVLASSLGLV